MKGKGFFLALLFCLAALCGTVRADADFRMEDYLMRRAEIVRENAYRTGVVLTEEERQLDLRLAKWKAEAVSALGGRVPGDLAFLTDERIWESTLYGFCEALPKGADLHVHGMTMLPFDELLAFVRSREELYIGTGEENRYRLFCHASPGEAAADEMRVGDALERGVFTREELLRQWTLLGGADAQNIWDWFEGLFGRQGALAATQDLVEAYYVEAFRYYCRSGILHVEVRTELAGSPETAAAGAQAVLRALDRVREEVPDFRVNVIGTGLKALERDMDKTRALMENCVTVHNQVKDTRDPGGPRDFVTGFDLVNEEDASYPLTAYVGMLRGIMEKAPELVPLLHAGESVLPGSDNIIDAMLLGCRRIGHGLNLYRFPSLMEQVIRDGVCVEVSPVSNHMLRYVPDLRSHPAVEYLKRGVPVCLCSDDPGYMEHGTLTDDFFAAILCWDLGVAQIRQLCENSIRCSTLDASRREALMRAWEKQWACFLDFGK